MQVEGETEAVLKAAEQLGEVLRSSPATEMPGGAPPSLLTLANKPQPQQAQQAQVPPPQQQQQSPLAQGGPGLLAQGGLAARVTWVSLP